MKIQRPRRSTLNGVLFMALFACAAFFISTAEVFQAISLSPMIIGIVLGMIYANTLRSELPDTWVPGIQFCSKRLLRIGIILYGFRLTFADVAAVGTAGIVIDAIIVSTTLLLGILVGRLLHMDSETALLTATGSSICGAAAVLGAEATINTKPYKTAVAVATVVIFGTVAMLLYPVAYASGALDLSPTQMGIFAGSTLHEVAHAAGAGAAMGPEVAPTAVIVKMIRVMMLVPVLLIFAWWIAAKRRNSDSNTYGAKSRISIPWFAVIFLCVIGFNSFDLLPRGVVSVLNWLSTFFLTMAMSALGASTTIESLRKAGAKPFLLALVLWAWLLTAGYIMARYLAPALS